MCGFAGVCAPEGWGEAERAARAMGEYLQHRGPDDEGLHVEKGPDGPELALAFRRLSILDLENGHQPMRSEDGDLALVFNGEIYNHPVLKAELEAEGVRYRTRSDTETILHLYRKHGVEMLNRLEGMFAIALWDRKTRKLLLARDPSGIKPLYWAEWNGRLLFASELRALLVAGMRPEPDPVAIADYLAYGYAHSPRTVIKGVSKLEPGQLLLAGDGGVETRRWHAFKTGDDAFPDEAEAEAELERLLKESVRSQLLADVPVGAFLSGGVDSSLIAALMKRATDAKVSTFSIGFSGARHGLDESRYAAQVARHLGTDHHELVLPADVLKNVEDAFIALDEPLGDSAVLPTHLLAKHARKTVKVVLSGEGADELFAGYGRYKPLSVSHSIGKSPVWARGGAAAVARRLGKASGYKRIPFSGVKDWAESVRHCTPEKIAGSFTARGREALQTADPSAWLARMKGFTGFNGALAHDAQSVLADCLLMKADKATMAASLEARVPFLDSRLVAFALALDPAHKVKRFKGKWLLRKVARKFLPAGVATRRKHGFWVPWEEWVTDPKNERLSEAFSAPTLLAQGIFDPVVLGEELRAAREGKPSDHGFLYRAAVLTLWFDGVRGRV